MSMMMLRSSLRTARRLSQQHRCLAAQMPRPQSMDAELWQGHSKHTEGWETTVYVSYGAATVLLGMVIFFSPETNIQTWASAEAQARLDLKKKDPTIEFEFGKHYSDPSMKYEYEDSVSPENPFNEEDEDDDEEEEEEEEEEDDDDDDDDDE